MTAEARASIRHAISLSEGDKKLGEKLADISFEYVGKFAYAGEAEAISPLLLDKDLQYFLIAQVQSLAMKVLIGLMQTMGFRLNDEIAIGLPFAAMRQGTSDAGNEAVGEGPQTGA